MNDSKTFEEYAELVSRFKAGDESAYEQIYIKSQRLVYAICYGIDIVKCVIGFILVKKRIWVNNLVA